MYNISRQLTTGGRMSAIESRAIVEPFILNNKPRLLIHARRASRHSQSYRIFFTGTIAEAYGPNGSRRLFAGAAYKPVRRPQRPKKKSSVPHNPRSCGEDETICKVCKPRSRVTAIKAFYLAGDYQPDDESKIALGVLIPCKHCRKKFRWHISRKTGVVTPETMVYSWNVHTGHVLGFSIGWLLQACPDIGATYERYSQ
jgi:hypothetical protein